MSAFSPDSFVRHRIKSDWGVGRVTAVDADFVRVRFEIDSAEKRFPIATAPTLLDGVPNADVEPSVRAALASKRAAGPKRPSRTGGKCMACGAKLNRSRYSRDGQWKACPKCSVLHGEHHIYRRRPDAFGTTPERENEDSADGIQSYCYTCRQGEEPSFVGDDVRSCADLETQTKQP